MTDSATRNWEEQVKLIRWIALSDELFGWYGRMEMLELRISKLDNEWRLIVKGRRRGENLIAFLYGGSPWELIKDLAIGLKYHHMRWKEDRYTPPMGS